MMTNLLKQTNTIVKQAKFDANEMIKEKENSSKMLEVQRYATTNLNNTTSNSKRKTFNQGGSSSMVLAK